MLVMGENLCFNLIMYRYQFLLPPGAQGRGILHQTTFDQEYPCTKLLYFSLFIFPFAFFFFAEKENRGIINILAKRK